MAYTTINKSTDYFNTKLYTSTGNDNLAITGVGFEADLTWIKKRAVVSGSNTNEAHMLADQVRGGNYYLNSSSNAANASSSADLKSWQSDGFTLGTNNRVNQGSTPHTYASWNWKANGQGSSNTDGSINTTYTSVNTTAGFSISQYTGTGSLATVGHGLGVVPSVIITKVLTTTHNWGVYHQGLGNTSAIYLDLTNDKSDSSAWWNNTSPTSSVFTINTRNEVNQGSQNYIAYCFAEKQGYSKFGSYVGNGNADGTFIYTGFKPAWIMIKRAIGGTDNWMIYDNKRIGFNQSNYNMVANSESSENTGIPIDILSNGFKARASEGNTNVSGNTYIYMAFGQSLVGSNNVPCTAR